MIESPDALLFEPLATVDPDADAPLNPNAPVDQEPAVVKQQHITSSFRKTLKHLQTKAGYPARFRGFSIFLVYTALGNTIASTLSALPLVPTAVAAILTSVLLSNFAMAWTHIVISEPSPKRWFRRLPTMRMWKKIAVPTAILAVAEQVALVLPLILVKVYGLDHLRDNPSAMTGHRQTIITLQSLSVFFSGLVVAFFVVIPANVALTRVQASLLDDTEETIVPFDRSFGGKVVPEIVGGAGIISILDAWRTFDWASRIRLAKAYAKVFAMQIVVFILFVSILAIEIFAIAHLDLEKIMPGNGGKGDDRGI
jgi:hypothetical protein